MMIPARPRRLTPPAPYGALLKRFADLSPPRARKSDQEKDARHLALVRFLPCLHCGQDPCYEAAHVRFASAAFGKASGLGKRPPDKFALPLCPEHHRIAKNAQHKQNELKFWHDLGINPLLVCQWLYAQSGDLVAMRAVVFMAIAERGKI